MRSLIAVPLVPRGRVMGDMELAGPRPGRFNSAWKIGMRERARLVGGDLGIQTQPGRGTRVVEWDADRLLF